jgi:hypothetical protein
MPSIGCLLFSAMTGRDQPMHKFSSRVNHQNIRCLAIACSALELTTWETLRIARIDDRSAKLSKSDLICQKLKFFRARPQNL